MASAPEDWRAEAIAAASLGVPLDDLLTLPGRYAGAVANLLATVSRMHGLMDKEPVDGAVVDVEASIPKH